MKLVDSWYLTRLSDNKSLLSHDVFIVVKLKIVISDSEMTFAHNSLYELCVSHM